MVALSMAELASSYPTAGGLYYWASKLGGAGWGWYTGWFNLIGQVAVTAGIDYGLATFVNILLNTWFGTPIAYGKTLIIYGIALLLHASMNIFGVRLVALLNDVSVWWHIGGVLIIVGFLFFAPTHHSLGQAFHSGFTTSGFPYWYGFLLGLLLAQYTFTGYDASAHMTEETIGAATRAPWGVVMSVVVSAVAGYILLMGLLIAMPTLLPHAATAACTGAGIHGTADCAAYTTAVTNGGNPVGYILNTALGTRIGTALLTVAVVAQFFCGMSSITANSRMIYAFSRDGAVPFSGVWHRLHQRYRTPANAIWLGATLSFLLAVPSLWNYTAYVAITSIAVIGLYISYVLPVYLRRRAGSSPSSAACGTWGDGARSINWIAIVWVDLHFDPVHAANGYARLSLVDAQLHRHRARHGGRRPDNLVVRQRAPLVQRPHGTGKRAGSGPHRGRDSARDSGHADRRTARLAQLNRLDRPLSLSRRPVAISIRLACYPMGDTRSNGGVGHGQTRRRD